MTGPAFAILFSVASILLAGFVSDRIGGIDALREGVAVTAVIAAFAGSVLLLLTYRRLRNSLRLQAA